MFFTKKTKDFERELKAIQSTLELDSKNYHCWVYRKWLCQYFDLYDSEKVEVEKYIYNDVFNNSAWSFRFFLMNKGELISLKDSTVLAREVDYTLGKIKEEPLNESAWNYLNG